MPLSGKFYQSTPLAEQEWTLVLPMMADRWVEFRTMLKTHADFSDFYALIDSLMKEAQRDYLGQDIIAVIPDAPSNLSASLDTGLLTWDAPEHALTYEVDHDGEISTVSEPEFAFEGLPGETHFFRVRAKSQSGLGLWSDDYEVTFVPAAPVMGTPERYGMDVKFVWSAVTGATSYKVYGAFGSGVDEDSTSVNTVNTEYTRTLNSGQTLYVRVAAVNGGGIGPLSDEVSMQVPVA